MAARFPDCWPALSDGWPAWIADAEGNVGSFLQLVARHTGAPVVVVAAIALVVSWRAFKHAVRFTIEVAIVVGVLFVATRLGWIRW
ncbi:MAG: hypothetical protein FWD17_08160 [Polyangiaceae bacterium]|nr:hypothetical protein [Polyangiaceae bacterium]